MLTKLVDEPLQDIGFINNLKSVFGPCPLLWLVPQPMKGTGLTYPVSKAVGGEFGIASDLDDWVDAVAGSREGEGSGSASGREGRFGGSINRRESERAGGGGGERWDDGEEV